MIRKVILFTLLVSTLTLNAQKAQRFGYVDMEYILENIPEYVESETKINAKALTWQNNIEAKQNEIDALKIDLGNEKALLTKELIEDKEEDIQIKELELKKLQDAYFGANGDLYFLRRQLVKPIQDLVFNAVQDIATKRKYDFVFDKSSDLIMLFSNKQYDISDIVITSISRAKKNDAANEKRNARSKKNNDTSVETKPAEINVEAQQKIDAKAQKRLDLQKNIELKRAEQIKRREDLLKANEAKKQQRIKEIEAAKKAKEEKQKQVESQENKNN